MIALYTDSIQDALEALLGLAPTTANDAALLGLFILMLLVLGGLFHLDRRSRIDLQDHKHERITDRENQQRLQKSLDAITNYHERINAMTQEYANERIRWESERSDTLIKHQEKMSAMLSSHHDNTSQLNAHYLGVVNDLQVQVVRLENRVDALSKEIDTNNRRIDELVKERDLLREEIIQLRKERDDLIRQIASQGVFAFQTSAT